MDFTCTIYEKLLRTLLRQGFYFQTFEEFIENPAEKSIILRHDVDKRPDFALRLAMIETALGIKGSYHFRIVKGSNNPDIIRAMVSMGHELAYHYEDLNLAYSADGKSGNDDKDYVSEDNQTVYQKAYSSFLSNLEYFRKFYPVKVISMHGSPMSGIDNRDLWKEVDYHEAGIICEPYFDIDYSKVLYLTDTGRRWDGQKFNVRDRVEMGFGSTKGKPLSETFGFISTSGIIEAVESGKFPRQVIISTHPQRWTNKLIAWLTEFLFQRLKNMVKYFIVVAGNKEK